MRPTCWNVCARCSALHEAGRVVRLQLGEHVIDCTNRAAIMGILNVSDDSPVAASIVDASAARDRGIELQRQGAEIIDVGAHSTAAGARELSAQEEIERVCPVIEALSAAGIATSIDTWSAEVARAAAESGVNLLNDVTGFADPAMAAVAVDHQLPAVVMHMRGDPKRNAEVDQHYDDIATEVRAYLIDRASALEATGSGQVWLDPGFAFAKSAQDNVRLLDGLPALVATGYPVLVSASRKGFLGELLGRGDDQQAAGILEATVAFNVLAARHGAHVVRVHDVEVIADALKVEGAIRATLDGQPDRR